MSTLRNRKFYVLYVIGAVMIAATMLISSCAPQAAATTEAPPVEAPTQAEVAPTQAEAAPTQEEAAPTTAPVQEERPPLVLLATGDVVSFDPMYTQSSSEAERSSNLALLWFDDQGELKPQLAESVTPIDDYTWEIKLKQGYTFWDGRPVDAQAVKFTYDRGQRLLEAGEGDVTFGFTALGMESMEIIDDYTLHFKTVDPDPITPVHLAYRETYILHPEYYAENGPEVTGLKPLGAGPYEFVEYVPGEYYKFKAYEGYRDGVADIKEVVVRVVPELATRINELKAGSADVISNLTPDLFPEIEDTPGLHVSNVPGMTRIMVQIKQGRHPALADPLVRQAMNYAVDRYGIIDSLFGKYGKASCDILNPPRQNPDQWCYPYDPDKAAELLDEAGWVLGADGVREKDGVKLSLEMDSPNGSYPYDKEMAQIIVEQLEAVGIEISDFQVRDRAVLSEMRKNQGEGYRDLMFMGSGADYECADDLLLVEANSGSNRGSWKNDEFEAMFNELKTIYDPQERLKKCWQMEQLAIDDAAQIFLYIKPNSWGVSDRVNWNARPDQRNWWYGASWAD
jgi:peptide/nickel transport system substrate-binding protein